LIVYFLLDGHSIQAVSFTVKKYFSIF